MVSHLFGSSVFIELVEYKLVVLAIDIRIEFPVGERARSALAELDIGFGIQHFGMQEITHRLLPFLNTFATFDDDRVRAAAGQIQRGEHSRRAETDYHGLQIVRPLRIFEFWNRRRLRHARASHKGAVMVGDGHLHLKIVLHTVLLPCIHRLPHNPKTGQIFRPDFELLAHEVFYVSR